MSLKILILILFLQGFNQYGLYNEKGKFIGALTIHEDNLYIKIRGYRADIYKIKFKEGNNIYPIYYIENEEMKGSVVIEAYRIVVRVIIDNKYHKTEIFYRKT